jgi:hypothetical protein
MQAWDFLGRLRRTLMNPFCTMDPQLFDFHQIRGCLKSNILLLAAKFYLESLGLSKMQQSVFSRKILFGLFGPGGTGY